MDFTSKKLRVAFLLVAADMIATVLAFYGVNFPTEPFTTLNTIGLAYLTGQSAIDAVAAWKTGSTKKPPSGDTTPAA